MQNAEWKTSKLNAALKRKLKSGPERGGVVLVSGKVIEFANQSQEPNSSFAIDVAELVDIADEIAATWHTHPDASNNLSVEDWETFVQWPEQLHAIVGTNGLRWYRVRNGAVVNA